MTQSLDIQYKSLALLQMFILDSLYGNTATLRGLQCDAHGRGYVITPWLDSFHNTYVILAGTIC